MFLKAFSQKMLECGHNLMRKGEMKDRESCDFTGAIPQPPAGEVERLRERLLFELKFDSEPYTLDQVEAAIGRASDSQGDQERCYGAKRIARHEVTVDPVPVEVRDCPGCPDCNPAPTQVEGDVPDEHGVTANDRAVVDDYAKRCDDELAALPEPPGIPPHLFAGSGSQPEGGNEEDWPEEVLLHKPPGGKRIRIAPSCPAPGFEKSWPYETRRYLPATSQDSSGLEDEIAERGGFVPNATYEAALEKERDAAAVAERKASLADAALNESKALTRTFRDRAERAETALEELAAEADREAEEALSRRDALNLAQRATRLRHECIAHVHSTHAKRLREKAAKLREGK